MNVLRKAVFIGVYGMYWKGFGFRFFVEKLIGIINGEGILVLVFVGEVVKLILLF